MTEQNDEMKFRQKNASEALDFSSTVPYNGGALWSKVEQSGSDWG